MALVRTTLSSACAATDSSIKVASATSISPGVQIRIDDETMYVTKAYVLASTTVPVVRGRNGTQSAAHPTTAGVVHGLPSDSEWSVQSADVPVQYPLAGRARRTASYSAAGAITLPLPGEDVLAIINGTSVCAMTIAAPGKAIEGSELIIAANGAAAHTLTFAGGLSGAGTSYDVITINATAPVALRFIAVNSLWQCFVATPLQGTVTNITATVA